MIEKRTNTKNAVDRKDLSRKRATTPAATATPILARGLGTTS